MLLNLEDLVLEFDKIKKLESIVSFTNQRLRKRADKESWSVIQRLEDLGRYAKTCPRT